MSKPLLGMLNVLPDGIPTLLEDVFGFKQGTFIPLSYFILKYKLEVQVGSL